MSYFRKKPVTIEATQWNGGMTGLKAIKAMYPSLQTLSITSNGKDVSYWCIGTLEGSHVVSVGDWIIKGVKGEFYPCKHDIFELTYEAVTEATS